MNRIKGVWKSNKGFSLFMVILAIALASILGLLVLYVALSNFRMRASGQKEQSSFYTAEQALEEIRTGLQEDVAEAMASAYTEVMESYNVVDEDASATLDVLRQNKYKDAYLKKLKERLQTGPDGQAVASPELYSLERLQSYVDADKEKNGFDTERETLIVTTVPGGSGKNKLTVEEAQVTLKNLRVTYVDAYGYASIIETDICLGIPGVQFPTPSTLPDLMNMIIVADQGIFCKGDNVDANEIRGSVYAGLLPKALLSGTAAGDRMDVSLYLGQGSSVTFTNGEKVVCRGKVFADNNKSFTVAEGTNLWAEGVDVTASSISLLGKTYLADDLTINGGANLKSSSVTIGGEYYGYGNPASALDENNRNKQYYGLESGSGKSSADLSSAIIVNSKSATLDLSKAEKLMLAGRSYLFSSALKTSQTTGSLQNASNTDVALGESITVKGSQLAYLLPEKLLGESAGNTVLHNPMPGEDYLQAVEENANAGASGNGQQLVGSFGLPLKWTEGCSEYGGKSLSQLGLDANEPIKAVYYVAANGKTYVYFYLNFQDDASLTAFMETYYGNNKTSKETLDRALSFYFGSNSAVKVSDSAAYLRYVTNGNVLSYNGSTGQGSLSAATMPTAGQSDLEEQLSYQNMWYALNRKMIGSVDLLNSAVKDADGNVDHDETDGSRSVYDNLVNEKAMVKFVKEHNAADLFYQYTDQSDSGFSVIMAHNGGDSVTVGSGAAAENVAGTDTPIVIDANLASALRLVVCTGDVTIKKGVTFYGIIMTKGTITLEPGARLISQPLDAARIFQAQINESAGAGASPKDFFWDGDKYVLGNSSTDSTDTGSGSTYRAEDYLSYKNWRKK